jgi:hypothetical protein
MSDPPPQAAEEGPWQAAATALYWHMVRCPVQPSDGAMEPWAREAVRLLVRDNTAVHEARAPLNARRQYQLRAQGGPTAVIRYCLLPIRDAVADHATPAWLPWGADIVPEEVIDEYWRMHDLDYPQDETRHGSEPQEAQSGRDQATWETQGTRNDGSDGE